MAKLTKKQKEAFAKFDKNQCYSLEEAVEIVKNITYTKFDASVDIDVRLGVDPRKANQMVRGSVTLPHGTGKTVRVLVLCTPDKEEEAKAAGADYYGLDEYITKIKAENNLLKKELVARPEASEAGGEEAEQLNAVIDERISKPGGGDGSSSRLFRCIDD